MEIKIENKTISSIQFTDAEIAWKIEDALLVLQHLKTVDKIVLGGDILTKELDYTYDNWYYNVESRQELQFNSSLSITLATKYITDYIEKNGTHFFVVFVTE